MKYYRISWEQDITKTISENVHAPNEESALEYAKNLSNMTKRMNPAITEVRNHKVELAEDDFSFDKFVADTDWRDIENEHDAAERAFKYCQDHYRGRIHKIVPCLNLISPSSFDFPCRITYRENERVQIFHEGICSGWNLLLKESKYIAQGMGWECDLGGEFNTLQEAINYINEHKDARMLPRPV